ncbi:MarR family transcriptional regulator, partial [Bacillus licheniformis]|uniref:MarR family winged helix-turn-helix transcriptional regulator n=2 Tax=Bacillaceae TaxID=186817 RepID=UPI000BA74D7A
NKHCCSTEEYKISLAQSHILDELRRRSKPSMQEVSESLGIDITTFSRQIQNLIKMGLVEKTANPSDKRVFTLSLTNEGKKVNQSIDDRVNNYLKEVFSHMNEFEQDIVIRSIKLLSVSMNKTKYFSKNTRESDCS